MARRVLLVGVAAIAASVSFGQSTSLIERFMAMEDDAEREELLEGMSRAELGAFHHDLRTAAQELQRNRIDIERNVLEFERLTRSARLGDESSDVALRGFVTVIEAGAEAVERFGRTMSADEYGKFRGNLRHRVEQRVAIAQQLEINAMREAALIREMSFSPLVKPDNPRCDPGSFCRLGCRGRGSECNRIIANVAADCYAVATIRYEECMIDLDSEDERDAQTAYCNVEDAINGAFCESQYGDNEVACGTASMECGSCCAELPGDLFVGFQHCFRPFNNVSISTSGPPRLSQYPLQ